MSLHKSWWVDVRRKPKAFSSLYRNLNFKTKLYFHALHPFIEDGDHLNCRQIPTLNLNPEPNCWPSLTKPYKWYLCPFTLSGYPIVRFNSLSVLAFHSVCPPVKSSSDVFSWWKYLRRQLETPSVLLRWSSRSIKAPSFFMFSYFITTLRFILTFCVHSPSGIQLLRGLSSPPLELVWPNSNFLALVQKI